MLYGVSYYPEHKTQEELAHDLALIQESGINTVRMGEFAWCRMEPEEGKFHFEWLDRVIEELGQAGIRTVICTPTACPPAWMVSAYPDMLYQDNRGIRRPFGGRRHYCYNHEAYRRRCSVIAGEIGRRYGSNPYVAGFQIDNEPAQEGTGRCTCPVCRDKFQDWMRNRYGTIEAFNARSGAVFWSQEYNDFTQITPPVNSIEVGAQTQIRAFYENPTVRLDFERFCSDSQIEFQNIQADILKEHTSMPVTTNATGLATNSIDYYKSTQNLDCYAFDYYPGLRDAAVDSYPYAFARGVKNGAPFWILEFMSGGGHRLSGSGRLQPNPGALKQAVIQSFAHGAQMMLHFQFRSFPMGAEQLNYAIVDMDGIPRRRYYEMQETAQLLKILEPLSAAAFPSETAILLNYDTHWALRIKPVNDPDFNYLDFGQKLYRNLERIGINADVMSVNGSFETYKAVILPAAFLMTDEVRQRLKAYVEKGGILIATFLTGVKNEDNIGCTSPLPAGLTELFGICVEEVEPVFKQNRTRLELRISADEDAPGVVTADGMWSELLSGTAGCLGHYLEDYKRGSMVVSAHTYGKGKAYYVGTDLSQEAWRTFLTSVLDPVCLLKNEIEVPEGVEAVGRILNGKRLYYLFNYNTSAVSIDLDRDYRDCLTGELCGHELVLKRNGVGVLAAV